MTPARDAPLLQDVAATLANRPVAIVLGHEGDGLTDDAISRVHASRSHRDGEWVDSVNVATAAAIALYEMGSGVISAIVEITSGFVESRESEIELAGSTSSMSLRD